MFRKKEYSLTQKGLDAIDKIIKSSPQYKQLIDDFIEYLEWIISKKIGLDVRERIEYKIDELMKIRDE